MNTYNVGGMSCAACSARVEKAVSKLDGVDTCSVNLLTNTMTVSGSADPADIIAAVVAAGYTAEKKGEKKINTAEQEDALADKETPKLLRRLVSSLVFLAVLMYVSMGHMMWGWPLPEALAQNHVGLGLIQLLLTVAVMVINQKFFISGFKALWHRAPNMDSLVALGSSAAFVYSTYALYAMTDAIARGDHSGAMVYMHEFYFESAAMILALITVGKMLEARSKGKTTDALKSLMKLAPETATVIREGKEVRIAAREVGVGDVFVVRPGENIPVDGVVIEGESAVNEAALTGESIPVDKAVGDNVSAATLNHSGFIKCRATRVGEDTALSQIIKMVSDAASTKAPIAKIADKVSGVFVPVVITVAVITTVVWLILGEGIGFALARGISVLVISCPCALGLATPVAIMVGNGVGARNGILFKTAESLEECGKVKTVALDKTGTVTSGEPRVTDIIPTQGINESTLLSLAYTLEKKSEHPLARAITVYCEENGIAAGELSSFKALAGRGLTGMQGEKELYGGNLTLISEVSELDDGIRAVSERLAKEGKTPLFFAENRKYVGLIAVADTIKEDSKAAIEKLHAMGLKTVMLTGDNENTARAVADAAGIDEVIAGVMPDGKESVIKQLKENGRVAMVGDGINDAPALTRADTGIAIGAGTDIAIDAADVVLMKSSLADVSTAIRLSRATFNNIRQNLFWAFIYNAVGIPIAAGVLIPFGIQLDPMFAAAAMSLSSFCVVTNSLRLNLFKADGNKNVKKEKKKMEKTVKIEGMMCGHCSGRVKKVLEAMNGVESADVSHETGLAKIKLSADVSDEAIKSAIEAEGYTVIE
ncbi:MAG: heavy metal translocating P-type ATPase [Clostridia bacterium]|nr:heavy metal translocating P-type ATPase [Clostridia bacterium]